MNSIGRTALGCIAGLVIAGPATATVIDFESTPTGYYSSLTIGAVTFSYLGGGFDVTSACPGSPICGNALLGNPYGSAAFNATIAGGTSSFSIGFGDFNSDAETGYLEAFDSLGNSLDSDSAFIPGSLYGGATLAVSSGSPNIAYVRFWTGGDYPGSVYWDNAEYGGTAAVPEPETYAMMLAGLGMLGFIARRRKQQAAA